MPTRTTAVDSRASFIADHKSIARLGGGAQVDWANVATTDADGRKILRAGTPVGSALGAGKINPRVVTTNPAIGIMETTAVQSDTVHSLSGYSVIVGGVIYSNLLNGGAPDAATQAELDDNGTGFVFQTYADTRA